MTKFTTLSILVTQFSIDARIKKEYRKLTENYSMDYNGSRKIV